MYVLAAIKDVNFMLYKQIRWRNVIKRCEIVSQSWYIHCRLMPTRLSWFVVLMPVCFGPGRLGNIVPFIQINRTEQQYILWRPRRRSAPGRLSRAGPTPRKPQYMMLFSSIYLNKRYYVAQSARTKANRHQHNKPR